MEQPDTLIAMNARRYHRIKTEAEWRKAVDLSHHEPVAIYKHSSLCELCLMASDKLSALQRDTDPPIYEVVVQEARPLSNLIEKELGIRHESPQVIVLQKGDAVFNASHWGVTASAVRDAVARTAP